MPSIKQEKQDTNQAPAELGEQERLIAKGVVTALGQPPDLHRLTVRRLWQDRYRVNIVVGADASSAKIVHSYFVVADGAGNIVQATPEITKCY